MGGTGGAQRNTEIKKLMAELIVIKIGGNIIDDEEKLFHAEKLCCCGRKNIGSRR